MFENFFRLFATEAPRKTDDGATAVEYALMVALIALAIIATVLALGGKLSTFFASVAAAI